MEPEEGEEEKKDIEVVTGDDSDLDISDVYDHINFDKVRDNPEKKNIIIPGVKKEDSNSENENEDKKEKGLSF